HRPLQRVGDLEKLHEVTDTLQRAMDDVASVTGKIDRGEGTIGALVNDPTTVENLNETVENVNAVVQSFSGLRAEVYYIGRYYAGTPIPARHRDTFFYGNPLAGSGANTVGVALHPQEDFWWTFEIVDHPQGTISWTENYVPETGEAFTTWEREPNFRLSFMMNKRFQWCGGTCKVGFRLGIKESGGGLGASIWTARDRLSFHLDAFDFDLGSYPAV